MMIAGYNRMFYKKLARRVAKIAMKIVPRLVHRMSRCITLCQQEDVRKVAQIRLSL
ncbi:hypothetical protein L585_08170 [Pantoea ananatis BRT175]|nr:hypothetical protein L585_08170 [Pantoea ananatis BRT175]